MGLFSKGNRNDSVHAERVAQQQLPLPGLAEYASAHGWRSAGPAAFDEDVGSYVHTMTRNLYGVPDSIVNIGYGVYETRYANAYTANLNGRKSVIANAYTTIRLMGPQVGPGSDAGVSVCVAELAEPMPVLLVDLKQYQPFSTSWDLVPTGDPAFDHRFTVRGIEAGFTRQVLGTVSGMLMSRDDWVFQMAGEQVMCVCSAPFTSADDMLQRLQVLDQFAAAMPAQAGLYNRIPGFPTFPDGTPLDPARPEEMEAKLAALSKEQRDQVLQQVQAYKANFRHRR